MKCWRKESWPLALAFVLAFMSFACSTKPDNPAAVREKAADTTAQIKRDSKAIAQGICEGWTRDKTLDINTASKEQLQALSGVTPKMATNIVAHRPYNKVSELLERHVITKVEYDKLEGQLTVKR